jgi:hypothetical protein
MARHCGRPPREMQAAIGNPSRIAAPHSPSHANVEQCQPPVPYQPSRGKRPVPYQPSPRAASSPDRPSRRAAGSCISRAAASGRFLWRPRERRVPIAEPPQAAGFYQPSRGERPVSYQPEPRQAAGSPISRACASGRFPISRAAQAAGSLQPSAQAAGPVRPSRAAGPDQPSLRKRPVPQPSRASGRFPISRAAQAAGCPISRAAASGRFPISRAAASGRLASDNGWQPKPPRPSPANAEWTRDFLECGAHRRRFTDALEATPTVPALVVRRREPTTAVVEPTRAASESGAEVAALQKPVPPRQPRPLNGRETFWSAAPPGAALRTPSKRRQRFRHSSCGVASQPPLSSSRLVRQAKAAPEVAALQKPPPPRQPLTAEWTRALWSAAPTGAALRTPSQRRQRLRHSRVCAASQQPPSSSRLCAASESGA